MSCRGGTMLGLGRQKSECKAELDALNMSHAIIEFETDGTIITANENFLGLMGYALSDIQGKHHSLFVDPQDVNSADYRQFWDKLRRGEFQSGQFRRYTRGQQEVWIEAAYNPVLNRKGHVCRIVKYASDITARQREYADLRGQVNAMKRSQAVIEFDLNGNVLDANDNFLNAMGYRLEDVKGQHHSLFVDAQYRTSAEYRQFWDKLARGVFQAGQYKRYGRGGREVWIEASYNPIFDLNGRPYKVVKFATDINAQIELLSNLKKLIDENFGAIDQAIHRSSDQATGTVHAVTNASENIQTVASSAEELAASIREIASTMVRTNAATDTVHDQTTAADQVTQRLADAARSMGGIIELIQNIANQINLLALNATIESARAGDAGKGFAVVASEVKNLAAQARDATDQIGREIENMQTMSGEVVNALSIIANSINTVREYVAGTASAVEEQSAVTESISSSMQAAVGAIATIQDNTGHISSSVNQVAQVVETTKNAVRVLAR
jgi:methyl-accepting chemotaxis protein